MATEVGRRDRPAEVVAGYLATIAIFAGAIALVYRPARLAPAAMIVALIAVGIGGRHERLSSFAVAVTTICFVAGMVIAVLGHRPLF